VAEHPLRQVRTRRGWGLSEVAFRASTTEATVSRIETRKQFPKPELLRRLMAVSGLTADSFVHARFPEENR
jgi:transcriptional regulator with XRE-family HTH domain